MVAFFVDISQFFLHTPSFDKIMTTLTIPIHSFVDLITNSSSEIYVAANASTVKAVKALVDNILAVGGSTLKADDLFDFKLNIAGYDDEGNETSLDAESDAGKAYLRNSNSAVQVDLVVTVKQKSPEAKKAAKTLSGLSGLFDISEQYN